ncbi:Alpha-1,6-mannosylglycoprotein 6-beta-N-acetylglucosaminyltransferase B [Anabarilius grahami]|uniref:alpha-1,6-mannosyl-glycoprotein 6-beta-N-acetylglucosaminyltransferase n=1 Tax=Anabarilius grahami TaxID=495550 RepID=A0A3N0YH72_ANAGA|nr:Alpha-1,6-mannosylglycoprotein 6-beta-N-acetylglucosaminyltransferase B [Anabarilius grahami]
MNVACGGGDRQATCLEIRHFATNAGEIWSGCCETPGCMSSALQAARARCADQSCTRAADRGEAFFRSDLSLLLERVGSGKESLSFMRRRMRRLAAQWAAAARRLEERLHGQYREQKRIMVHVGFLTEESGDVFSPKVLKGGPLGEMVQWADILTTLHVLGHNLKISLSVKELQGRRQKITVQVVYWTQAEVTVMTGWMLENSGSRSETRMTDDTHTQTWNTGGSSETQETGQ